MATRGQVKWFDPKKGYGFIVGPEGQDVFVHFSQIQGEGFRSLRDGEDVDYELIQGDKGWQAQLVTRMEVPPTPAPGVSPGTAPGVETGKPDRGEKRHAEAQAQGQVETAPVSSIPAMPSRGYSNRISEL